MHKAAKLREGLPHPVGVVQPAPFGLQPWGQYYTSTGRESASLYNGRRDESNAGLPRHPGVKRAVYQHDLLSAA